MGTVLRPRASRDLRVDDMTDDFAVRRALLDAPYDPDDSFPRDCLIPFPERRAAPAGADPARPAASASRLPQMRAPSPFPSAAFDALGWVAFSIALLALILVIGHALQTIGGGA